MPLMLVSVFSESRCAFAAWSLGTAHGAVLLSSWRPSQSALVLLAVSSMRAIGFSEPDATGVMVLWRALGANLVLYLFWTVAFAPWDY
ncbi:hypothetical protein N7510_004177 [Penicillium lagena]|uniref:uncharacterized protein n=1 Tax=Penicillium lagena TaxID=94218 RepID=UPI0025400842|nr:uncharacterized protein N7510_004177 [Penicillium lagena]KAJ5620193.1 hypothetical protein N7510_004177 [Penicillium lagena]